MHRRGPKSGTGRIFYLQRELISTYKEKEKSQLLQRWEAYKNKIDSLANGDWMIAYNHTESGRRNLSIAISDDAGKRVN